MAKSVNIFLPLVELIGSSIPKYLANTLNTFPSKTALDSLLEKDEIAAAELGIYAMQSSGLREVSNPSEILLSQRDEELSGITIGATLEGARPMLIETQALVLSLIHI